MIAPEPDQSLADIVADMEQDTIDVGRWSGIINAVGCSDLAVQEDDLLVIARAIEHLGESLKER